MPRRDRRYTARPEKEKEAERARALKNYYERRRLELPARGKRTLEQQQFHGRAQQLRRKYNLTPAEYDLLHEQQLGLCAICQRPETALKSKGDTPKRLAVDHDHKTQCYRGLLCAACNIALGLFEDDILRLQAAISYLHKHL